MVVEEVEVIHRLWVRLDSAGSIYLAVSRAESEQQATRVSGVESVVGLGQSSGISVPDIDYARRDCDMRGCCKCNLPGGQVILGRTADPQSAVAELFYLGGKSGGDIVVAHNLRCVLTE